MDAEVVFRLSERPGKLRLQHPLVTVTPRAGVAGIILRLHAETGNKLMHHGNSQFLCEIARNRSMNFIFE